MGGKARRWAALDEELRDAMFRRSIIGVERAIAAGARMSRRAGGLDHTPLLRAVSHSMHAHPNAAIVRALLAAGSKVNLRAKYRTTPLLEAASWSSAEIIELLLDAGAEPNAVDEYGKSAIRRAVDGHGRDTLATIEAKIAVLLEGGVELPAGVVATPEGVMKKLVGYQAPPRTDGKVLHSAAYWGHPGAIERILRHTNNVDQRQPGAFGHTPLMVAARQRRPRCVEILLAAGADPTAKNKFGFSARDIALATEEDEVIGQVFGVPAEQVRAEAPNATEVARLRAEILEGLRSGERYYNGQRWGQGDVGYDYDVYFREGRYIVEEDWCEQGVRKRPYADTDDELMRRLLDRGSTAQWSRLRNYELIAERMRDC